MTSPLITISIPTYKGADLIGETIRSVLAQSIQDFEILILDDASPDETREVVYGINDPRIIYHRNETNLGPVENWNIGLKRAKGRYYKLLPHDDLLRPGCLERQIKVFENDRKQEIALVFGARDVIDPQGQSVISRAPFGRKAKRINSSTLINNCVASGTNIIGEPGNGLIRSELLPKIGAYDSGQTYTVDMNFWFRALAFGEGYYTGEIDSAFRLHPQSWSNALMDVQSKAFRLTVKDFAAREEFNISIISQLMGTVRAPLNAILRRLFYRIYFT